MSHALGLKILWLMVAICCPVLYGQNSQDLYPQVFGDLSARNLSDEQLSRLTELAKTYGPQIEAADEAARLTDAQRLAREDALRQVVATRKKGAAAISMIAQAIQLTDAQRQAAKLTIRLRQEFDAQVASWLGAAALDNPDIAVSENADATGYLIIRFSDAVAIDRERIESTGMTDVLALQTLLKEFAVGKIEPVVSTALIQTIDSKHAKLAKRIASYYRIDARQKDERWNTILTQLRQLDEIDAAYLETKLTDPCGTAVVTTDEPYAFRQGYLDASPDGIDARYAWQQSNGTGCEVGLTDIETSWNLDHEDLSTVPMGLAYGDIKHGDHGTAALGEIVATDNSVGVVGIAPHASYVVLSSWYKTSGPDSHIASAVLSALPLMYAGDVLLIVVQRSGYPVETDDLDFDIIQLAIAEGMIVVEAAGNGGKNLDAFTHPSSGTQVLNRSGAEFQDSGAIIVGAVNPRDSNNRAAFSCYGSRVDCFAWGKFVTTSGYGDLDPGDGDPNKTYTRRYNGTSSAAPIIAGAAVIVQGLSTQNLARVVSPDEMRLTLSNPTTGTPQGPDVTGHIGVMPDLRKIIDDRVLESLSRHGQ